MKACIRLLALRVRSVIVSLLLLRLSSRCRGLLPRELLHARSEFLVQFLVRLLDLHRLAIVVAVLFPLKLDGRSCVYSP